nr:hypothetical protein [Tanacetum cinerariifolium]
NEYAKLWNDWYKKCDECKHDKFSYDKAYKDMQQKIERLQAQLGDLKGKCKDTSCVSDTQNQVFQKLENANVELEFQIERLQAQLGDLKGKCKDTSCVSDTQNQVFQKLKNANVELEFQVFNYARENAHLKTTYINLFDSISVTRAQTETKIASLQNELQCNIYKNAKLRTQLFKKVSDQKDNNQDSSKNTKFAKQPNVEILPKIGETNALSKPLTYNSVSTPRVSKGVNNDKVIAPGMFRISPDKVSREAKKVPNTPEIKKPKKVGTRKSLATPKPRKPRFLLRWSPTGRLFDHDGKLVASSNSESHVDCSNGDNACTSNAMEPKIKRFPNSTSLLGRLSRFICGASIQVIPST